MEKIETFQPKEIICDICGGSHPTYACKEKIDIETKRNEYLKKLKQGEPGKVGTLKETQKEGLIDEDFNAKKEKYRQELLRGKPEQVEEKKKAIREGRK